MSVKLVLMIFIFSCAYANLSFSSSFEFLKCIPVTNKNIQNATVNPGRIKTINHIESSLDYGLDWHNETITDCERTVQWNVSLPSETSIDVSLKSCIFIENSRLIVLTCKPVNDVTAPTSRIGFINKCCPHGYIYSSEFNKCLIGEADFTLYSHILDRPMIFVDNPFQCANNEVLVEYSVSANSIVFKENNLVWQNESRSLKISEFCIEAIDGINRNTSLVPVKNNQQNQQYLIRTCQQSKICDSLPCVRRCCSDGEIYFKKNMTTICKRDESDIFESFSSLKINGNFTKPPG